MKARTGPVWLRHWGAAHWTILALGALVVIFVVWAANAQLGQTVRAPGQVIASARTQTITAPIDGMVAQLLVAEGEQVHKGQVLVRLDRIQAAAAYDDSLGKVIALRAALVRLRAEVLGTPLVFSEDLQRFPEFVENQKQLFAARQRALHQQLAALERSLFLVQDQIRVSRPLVDAGDMGRLELIALQGREADLAGSIANARNKYFSDAQAEMTKAEEDLATREQELADRASILERTEVRAPTDGIVRRMDVNTQGMRVRPGDVLLELVPTGGSYVFEAKLSPADVASLRRGLLARIKLDAFDYTIYGNLLSKVVYVSPDALTEKRYDGDHIYYQVQLEVAPDAVAAWRREGRGTQTIEVQPGMTGTTEIQTGTRTVLTYLTKPIVKTISESMGEP